MNFKLSCVDGGCNFCELRFSPFRRRWLYKAVGLFRYAHYIEIKLPVAVYIVIAGDNVVSCGRELNVEANRTVTIGFNRTYDGTASFIICRAGINGKVEISLLGGSRTYL